MISKEKRYPSSLDEIPRSRRKAMEENIRWFLRFSPEERIRISEREFRETLEYIETYRITGPWKEKGK